ncbi:hypothetical protein V8F33_008907 [Rhypophila sp. PSN 637]
MRSSIIKATILAVTAFGPDGTVASPIQDQSGDPNPQQVPPGSDGWGPFLLPPFLPPSIEPPSTKLPSFTTKPTTSRLVTREQETPRTAAPSAAPFAREALATRDDVKLLFHIKEYICAVDGHLKSGDLRHLPGPPYEMHPTPIHVNLTRGGILCWKTAVGSPPPQYFHLQQPLDLVVHKDGKGLRILGPMTCHWLFVEPSYSFSCSPDWLDVKTWYLSDEEKASHIGAGDHGAIARLATREQDTRNIAAPLQGETLLGQSKDSSWKPIEPGHLIIFPLVLQDPALRHRLCTIFGRYKSGEFPDRSLYDASGELNPIHVNLTEARLQCRPMDDREVFKRDLSVLFAPPQYFEFREKFNLFAQVDNSGCYVPEGELWCCFERMEWRVWRLGQDDRKHLEGVVRLLGNLRSGKRRNLLPSLKDSLKPEPGSRLNFTICAGDRLCWLYGDFKSGQVRTPLSYDGYASPAHFYLTNASYRCSQPPSSYRVNQPAQYTDFRFPKNWPNGIDLFVQQDNTGWRLVGDVDPKCYLPKGHFECTFSQLDVGVSGLNPSEREHLEHVAKIRDEVRRDGLEHDIDWMA